MLPVKLVHALLMTTVQSAGGVFVWVVPEVERGAVCRGKRGRGRVKFIFVVKNKMGIWRLVCE
jgi:hypothetical protein